MTSGIVDKTKRRITRSSEADPRAPAKGSTSNLNVHASQGRLRRDNGGVRHHRPAQPLPNDADVVPVGFGEQRRKTRELLDMLDVASENLRTRDRETKDRCVLYKWQGDRDTSAK